MPRTPGPSAAAAAPRQRPRREHGLRDHDPAARADRPRPRLVAEVMTPDDPGGRTHRAGRARLRLEGGDQPAQHLAQRCGRMDRRITAARHPVPAPDAPVPVVECARPAQSVVLLAPAALGEPRLVPQPDGPGLLQLLQGVHQSHGVGSPVLGLDPVPGAQMVPGRPVTVRGKPLQALAQRVPPQRQVDPRIADLSRKTPETGHCTATSVARTSTSRNGRTTTRSGSIDG